MRGSGRNNALERVTFEESREILRSGTWSGTETFANDRRGRDVVVTIAMTSGDGLSHALWARDFLARTEYTGDGSCLQNLIGTVAPVGVPRRGRWIDVRPPDAHGNWSRTALFDVDTPFAGTGVLRHRYEMADGVLSIVAERRSREAGSGFEPYWTLALRRVE